MPDYIEDYSQEQIDNFRFMADRYGISEEEIKDIDAGALISGFDLAGQDYTPEEVKTIIAKFGYMYKDDGGLGKLYGIFERESRELRPDDEIECIGFYENPGTLVIKTVFDLRHRVFYVDDTQPVDLDDEQLRTLGSLAGNYSIADWDRNTTGTEKDTTGNYAWKLVFYLSSGEFASCGGSSGDMSHVPPGFPEVRKELRSIIRSRKTAEENAGNNIGNNIENDGKE